MTPDAPTPQLKRDLGLFSSIMVVIGIMVGSGIFIVSADISRQVGSPGMMLAVWLFAALLTLSGAWSYGYLARAFPDAGGQYIFLRKAWGDLPAFLYGWALFFVIQTGTIAAVAVAFSKFFSVVCPFFSTQHVLFSIGSWQLTHQSLVPPVIIAALTALNCGGVKFGALLQNTFTVLKVIAVLGLIGIGFWVTQHTQTLSIGFAWPNDWSLQGSLESTPLAIAVAVGTASIGAIFSADSWNNITFLGSEVKNPRQTIPKAMVMGASLVLILYILANLAYLKILPFDAIAHAAEDRVGTAVMMQLFGPLGSLVMASVIMISTFGTVNGSILAGSRVFYAMAKDHLFFAPFATIHPESQTPRISLIGQGCIATLLALSGSFSQLLDFSIFTSLLFYITTALGLFKLTRDHAPQMGFTGWWHGVIPCVYLACLIGVCGVLAVCKPQFTLPGLAIVLAGIPIFWLWQQAHHKASSLHEVH